MRKAGFAILLLALLLSTGLFVQISVSQSADAYEYLGFASYVTSQEELEKTIALMESKGLNIYRISFKPSWEVPEGEVRGYNKAYIDYLLANTTFFIVVDGNHLYPAEAGSNYAAAHWDEVVNRVFKILQQYPNNSRIAVELINEYKLSDYDTKIQALINDIQSAGYTNAIVTNKMEQTWRKFEDPRNNTYQGMHFYFNSWEVYEAIDQIRLAQNKYGITKILNTEVGASLNEYKYYNQANVDALEAFLNQSQALGANNCIWMNNDTQNWQGYVQYGLNVNPPSPKPTPTPTPIPTPTATPTPTPTATANPTSNPTPNPTPTAKPTPTEKPTPTPTASPTSAPQPFLFTDSFESKKFNYWSGKGGEGKHSETIENMHPQDGRYNAKFSAN